jgi:outer membrane lipoprotein LolB
LKYLTPLLCLFLAGCVSVPRQTDDAIQDDERAQYLVEHANWTFNGRMAYAHEGKGGSAQIQWQQNGRVSDVHISAPLVMGSVRIRFDADNAQVFDASGRQLRSGKPEAILQELLQIPMPSSDLASGLRAFWPQSPEQSASAVLGVVEIADWSWRYADWRDEPVRLPGKIEIHRGQTRIRIVIDKWRELPGG